MTVTLNEPDTGIVFGAELRASIDCLTSELRARRNAEQELAQAVHPFTIPPMPLTISSNTGSLYLPNITGPQMGNFWDVRRISVTGYTAGTVSVYMNAVGAELLANFTTPAGPVTPNPVPTTPNSGSVLATGVAQQNTNPYPVTVVIAANGATITNVTVSGTTVGTTAGTYIVPAAGTISVSYTVATPTWTWSNASGAQIGATITGTQFFGKGQIILTGNDSLYFNATGITAASYLTVSFSGVEIAAPFIGGYLT